MPIFFGVAIGFFVMGTLTANAPKKKEEKPKAAVKPQSQSEEADKLFDEILEQLEKGKNVDFNALAKKIDDDEVRAKVLLKIKLHFDPTGSKAGKRLKFEEDGVSKEQADFNEMMDGLGSKCLTKMVESFVISALVIGFLWWVGGLEDVLQIFR